MPVIGSILVFAIIVFGMYVASHRLGGMQLLGALGLLATGITIVVWPGAAQWAAERVGVGRGADFVVYFAIVGGLFVAANFYFRFKRQEQQLVTIVRELALRNARVR